jgi:hypothetical protein
MSVYAEGMLRGFDRTTRLKTPRHPSRHRSTIGKAPVQGAFRNRLPDIEEEDLPWYEGRKAGTEAPRGDNLAYERTIEQTEVDLRSLGEELAWFPPSPYMVSFTRALIRKLQEIGGTDSTAFLRALGVDEFGDVDLDGMSGVGLLELLGAAYRSVDRDILRECGWDESDLRFSL